MANPLACHKNRQFNVQFDFAHFKWGRMPMTHQVTDQPFVILNRLCAFAVTHPRGLTNRGVIPHIIDHPHKPVIQHGIGRIQMLFHPGGNGTSCLCRLRALFVNFSTLFGGKWHMRILFLRLLQILYIGALRY